jgi:hypothetical protein
MGLYFLNISVDTVDPNPEHIPEDLSINDQESIIEIIVEKILGYEDAIKEYDDHDPEDHNTQTNIKIDLINRYLNGINIKQLIVETTKQKFPDFNSYLTIGFYKLFTPPPEI